MYSIFAKLLEKHNLTRYQVSKATGVSQSSLSDWSKGKSKPKYESMQKIADYFGVTVDYLLTGEQKEKPAQEMGEHLDFFGMRILATVRAGYGALAYEEDTGRCIGISRDWLCGRRRRKK